MTDLIKEIDDTGYVSPKILKFQRNAYLKQRDELLKVLKELFDAKSPSYHDCLDDGLNECEWCIAEKTIKKFEANDD